MPGQTLAAPLLALFLAVSSPWGRQTSDEEEPFTEPTRRFEVGVLFDLRLAFTDDTLSFMERGLGKLRYGGSAEGKKQVLGRLSQLSLTSDLRLTESVGARLHVNFDSDPDVGDAGERTDLIEAYLRYRLGVGDRNEVRGKAGLFFPAISLEHPGEAWTTFYTITPSILNGWIGEEIRSLGIEASFARVGIENEVSFTAAGFGWNDPSASLLAYRGWASTDRQTGFADRISIPPLSSFSEGGIFSAQAPWAEPIREVDDRVGFYAGAAWDNYRRFLVNALYYDNRARPVALESGQYGWATRFYEAGFLYSLSDGASGPELLFQVLGGDTWMGGSGPGQPKVTFDYRTAYLLGTVPFGRQRVSFRYDWFEMVDRDEFRDVDDNDEDGYGITLAYLVRTAETQRLAVELLGVRSDRPAREFLGLPTEATEWMLQLSYRFAF
jgi:hypothetical protein